MVSHDTAVLKSLLAQFPGFLIDYDNQDHYAGMAQRELRINHCQSCGHWIYPLSPMCPECWSFDVRADAISGVGTVYLYTILHQGAPIPGATFPYPLVAVELAEQAGLRYLATIVDCHLDELRLDMPVELTWIDRAGMPAPAFRPRSDLA